MSLGHIHMFAGRYSVWNVRLKPAACPFWTGTRSLSCSAQSWHQYMWKPWTQPELTRLIELHENRVPYRDISRELNRSVGSVKKRIDDFRAGFRTTATSKAHPWTKEDSELLQRMRDEGKSERDMRAVFPHRSIYSIKSRLTRIPKLSGIVHGSSDSSTTTSTSQLRQWTRQEEELLVELRRNQRLQYRDIAEQMDRSIHSVQWRSRQLLKRKEKLPWSDEDRKKVLELAAKGTPRRVIVSELSVPRSIRAVNNILARDKLIKSVVVPTATRHPLWSEDEDQLLIKLRTSNTPRLELQNYFPGRTLHGILGRWTRIAHLRAPSQSMQSD